MQVVQGLYKLDGFAETDVTKKDEVSLVEDTGGQFISSWRQVQNKTMLCEKDGEIEILTNRMRVSACGVPQRVWFISVLWGITVLEEIIQHKLACRNLVKWLLQFTGLSHTGGLICGSTRKNVCRTVSSCRSAVKGKVRTHTCVVSTLLILGHRNEFNSGFWKLSYDPNLPPIPRGLRNPLLNF